MHLPAGREYRRLGVCAFEERRGAEDVGLPLTHEA
jgi:hypothetical protein